MQFNSLWQLCATANHQTWSWNAFLVTLPLPYHHAMPLYGQVSKNAGSKLCSTLWCNHRVGSRAISFSSISLSRYNSFQQSEHNEHYDSQNDKFLLLLLQFFCAKLPAWNFVNQTCMFLCIKKKEKLRNYESVLLISLLRSVVYIRSFFIAWHFHFKGGRLIFIKRLFED